MADPKRPSGDYGGDATEMRAELWPCPELNREANDVGNET